MSVEIMTKTDFNDVKLEIIEIKELILTFLNSSQPFKKDILSNEELMDFSMESQIIQKF